MNTNDALRILGLNENFTKEELRKSYRKMSSKYHPDIAGESSTAKFIQVKKAYELLSTPRKVSSKISFTHQSIFSVVLQK